MCTEAYFKFFGSELDEEVSGEEMISEGKEDSDVANVVVDCGDTDWFTIIPSAIWIVLFLRKIIDIEGVFSSLLKVIDVLANQIFCDLVDAINFIFVGTPSLK